MNIDVVRDNFKNFGAAAGLHDIGKKAINRFVPLRVLRTMKLTRARLDERFLALPTEGDYTARFVEADELRQLARDPAHDIEMGFIDEALAAGDRCYAIFSGDKLASYGWYSRRPTPMTPTLTFQFDPAYVYMFKGFTLPAFRGKRLHAVGMARALDAYVKEGAKGILSYVESNNFASLKSCYRMGYEPIGTITVVTVGGRTHAYASRANRSYGLNVGVLTPTS